MTIDKDKEEFHEKAHLRTEPQRRRITIGCQDRFLMIFYTSAQYHVIQAYPLPVLDEDNKPFTYS